MGSANDEARWQKSEMQGFHQIVAITEDHINSNFDFYFQNKDPNLSKLNVEVEDEGTMSGTLDPPTVRFILEDFQQLGEDPRAYFFVNIKSGSFEYWTGHGKNSKMHTVSMSGWSLAFLVNFGIDKLATIPPEVAAIIGNSTSYSVSQLLFDFSNPDLSIPDVKRSQTPGLDLEKGEDASTYLNIYLTKYLKTLKEKKLNVIGHAVTIDPQAPKEPASIPPTSLRFQTAAFHPDAGATPVRESGRSQFLLLQMTANADFPSSHLGWSANWVADKAPATMAVARTVFIDSFLKDHLVLANRAILDTLNDVYYWKDGKTESGLPWAITKDPVPDSSLQWSKVDGGLDASWSAWDNPKTVDKAFGGYGMIKSKLNASVRFEPGKNTFKLSGTGVMWYSEYHVIPSSDPERHGDTTWYDIQEITINWDYTLTLNSVKDGVAEVVLSGSPTTTCKVEKGSGLWSAIFGPSQVESTQKRIKELIEGRLANDRVAEKIKDVLNKQTHFVFSGGSTFFFKDLIFNKHGDLLASLRYKGGS